MGSTELSKNAERKSSFDDLPQETVFEILLKLPVKSIIRSTLVNKSWRSLIKNPDFISAHIQRSVSCYDESAVLLVPYMGTTQSYCSLVSTDTSSLIKKFEFPFDTRRTSSEALFASLHGLVLLSTFDELSSRFKLYLWNPSLRTHRALVTSSPFDNRAYRWRTQILLAGLGFHKPTNDYRVVMAFSGAGLGFHKPTNDYRVVMAFSGADKKGKVYEEVAPKAEIYSLRELAWKELKNSKVPRLIPKNETYVDGRFYWLGTMLPETYSVLQLSTLRYSHNPEQLRILSFNFDTEEFGELLKLPDEVSSCAGQAAEFKLMEFEGSLCVCVFDFQYNRSSGQLFSIWSMRSENGVISWSLRFRFRLKEGVVRPLNITKSGSFIIKSYGYSNWNTRIFSCNLKSMHDRDIGLSKFEEYAGYSLISTVDTHFMESLVMYEGDQKSLLKSAE